MAHSLKLLYRMVEATASTVKMADTAVCNEASKR